MIKLIIPLVAPSLNKWYAGKHWSERNQTKNDWHSVVKLVCRMDKIKPVENFPVTISTKMYFKSKRKRDVSNGVTANKLAEDGLVVAGILPDDTIKYVCRHIIEEPVFGCKEDKTVLIILEPEEYLDLKLNNS